MELSCIKPNISTCIWTKHHEKHKSTQECTRGHKSTHEYTRVHTSTQEHNRTQEDTSVYKSTWMWWFECQRYLLGVTENLNEVWIPPFWRPHGLKKGMEACVQCVVRRLSSLNHMLQGIIGPIQIPFSCTIRVGILLHLFTQWVKYNCMTKFVHVNTQSK